MKLSVTLAILLSILPTAGPAQRPTAVETIEVSIVNVDVFVTDKAGNRVRGLTGDDFDVFENGVRQPITNFAEYSELPLPPAGESAPERSEGAGEGAQPQARTIIVFIERFYLPNFRNDPLFASLKKLLHQSIRPGDRATIVTWNRGVLLTQQEFTDSVPALDRSIDRIATLSSKPLMDPTAETRWSTGDIESFDGQAAANTVKYRGIGTSRTASDVDSLTGLGLEHLALLEKHKLQRKIRAINAVMRSIAASEGKKVMLLATHRLSLTAGAEYYYAAGGTNPLAPDMLEDLKSIQETANANGVTIYPVYPEGLLNTYALARLSSETASLNEASINVADFMVLNNETPALRQIADATGGLTAWGSDDVEKLFSRVREDFDSYYSLAYRIRNSGADKARNIVVKTRNNSLAVRSRRQFMEKSDVTRMEDRVIAALFRNPPSPGFDLRVEVGQRRLRRKQFAVPVTVHIPIAALTALPTGNQYAGAFSVYFAWIGKVGGISDTTHETRNFTIPAADMQKARGSHFTYEFELTADENTERVALGVLDEVSKEYALRLIELKQ